MLGSGGRCLSFPVSIAILSLLQAALVALPRARPAAWAESLRSPWWALIPAASIVVVIAIVAATPGSATALSYLALVAVPAARRARPRLADARLAPALGAGRDSAVRPRLGLEGRARRRGRRHCHLLARLRHPRLAARLGRPRPLAALGDLRDGDDRRDPRRRRTPPGPQRGPQRRRARRRAAPPAGDRTSAPPGWASATSSSPPPPAACSPPSAAASSPPPALGGRPRPRLRPALLRPRHPAGDGPGRGRAGIDAEAGAGGAGRRGRRSDPGDPRDREDRGEARRRSARLSARRRGRGPRAGGRSPPCRGRSRCRGRGCSRGSRRRR